MADGSHGHADAGPAAIGAVEENAGRGEGAAGRATSSSSSNDVGRVLPFLQPTMPINRFILLPLTMPERSVDLALGTKIPIGRRSHPSLNNLHISREQAIIELRREPGPFGRVLITMTNKGKNSSRVLSMGRRKQARVTSSTYCRLVPGDIVELLYDQQGRYAFKLVETSFDGSPLVHHTPLVPSVSAFRINYDPSVSCLSASSSKEELAGRASVSSGDGNGDGGEGLASSAASSSSARANAAGLSGISHSSSSSSGVGSGSGSGVDGSSAAALSQSPPNVLDARRRHRLSKGMGRPAAAEPSERALSGDAEGMDVHLRPLEDLVGGDMSVFASSKARVRHGGGSGNDAMEEWDEQDEQEDLAAADDDDDEEAAERLRVARLSAKDDEVAAAAVAGEVEDDDDAVASSSSSSAAAGEDAELEAALAEVPSRRATSSTAAVKAVPPSTPVLGGSRLGTASRGPPPSASAVNVASPSGFCSSSSSSSSFPVAAESLMSATEHTIRPSMNSLPMPIIGNILSFLPLNEIVRSAGVCKDWLQEVRSAGSVSLVDFGSLFAGNIQPDPVVFDRIVRQVSGRDYSFANCMWLTTGALLHAIGVRCGVSPVHAMPPIERQPPAVDQSQRNDLAQTLAVALGDALRVAAGGGTVGQGGPLYGVNWKTVLRDDDLKPYDFAWMRPLHSSASSSSSSSSSSSVSASDFGGSAGEGAHTYLRLFCGELTDAELRRNAVAAGRAGAAGGQSSSSSSSRSLWWRRTGSGFHAALQATAPDGPDPSPWLDTQDICLSFIQSEVVRSRAVNQWERMFGAIGVVVGRPSDVMPFGTVVARSYAEMSISARSLLHTDDASDNTSGHKVDDASSVSSASAPSSQLLVSGRCPLNSPAMAAAGTVFAPVEEMRIRAKAETDAGPADEKAAARARAVAEAAEIAAASAAAGKGAWGSAGAPSSQRSGSASSAAANDGSAGLAASDAAVKRVTDDVASIHALSVAYSTAAGDVFDFPLQLASALHWSRGGSPDTDPLVLMESNFCSFDLPAPIVENNPNTTAGVGGRRGADAKAAAAAAAAAAAVVADAVAPPVGSFTSRNLLGPPLPFAQVSLISGLDLHGCTRLAPQNLHLILRYCPHLTGLRLGACNQFSSSLLASVMPLLPRLRQLDLEYCINVDDNVLAAIGRNCSQLSRLQLVGCFGITDRGISAEGLLNQCTNLRRLNLRGCKEVGNAGVLSIARRCPQLRELCLSGLTTVSAEVIADLIIQCRRLSRFKADLWFEQGPNGGPLLETDSPVQSADGGKRLYRLLGSVRGAIRYILTILSPGHPLRDVLSARYKEPAAPPGYGVQGAGAPLPVPDTRTMEGADLMTPLFNRRSETEGGSQASVGELVAMAAVEAALSATAALGPMGGPAAAGAAAAAAAAAAADAEAEAAAELHGRPEPARWVPGADDGEGNLMD